MTTHTLLQQVLDALETDPPLTEIAKEALRSALAAPMSEPVFWMVKGNCVGGAKDQGHVWSRPPTAEEVALWADAGIDVEIVPLYAAPPAAPADSQPCTTKPVVSQKATNLTDNADMVMVPREPTPEMRHAGWNAWMLETQAALMRDPGPEQDGPRSNIAAAYRAMIAAAPPAAPAVPLTGGALGMEETHPNYVAGFKAGHAAGRKRAESTAPVVPDLMRDKALQQATALESTYNLKADKYIAGAVELLRQWPAPVVPSQHIIGYVSPRELESGPKHGSTVDVYREQMAGWVPVFAAPVVREPQDERIRWRDAVIKEAESALRVAEREFADMPTWANAGHAAKKVSHALAVIAALGIGGGNG